MVALMLTNQNLSALVAAHTKPRPLTDICVDGYDCIIVTKDLMRLTGLTMWQVAKFRDAGLIAPFKCGAAMNCRNMWRRDEVLAALGFRPVCKRTN